MSKSKESWKIEQLKNIAHTTAGGTPLRAVKSYWNGDIPWLKSGELGDNLNISDSSEYITKEGLSKSSAKLFPEGTLVIAMYGATAGKLGILGKPTATNQAVCSIQNTKGAFNNKYIFFYLLSIRNKIIKDSSGGAQPNISKKYIDNIKIPLPPLPEQKRIVAKLDALFERIDKSIALLEENIRLAEGLMGGVLEDTFDKLITDGSMAKFADCVNLQRGHNPPKKDFISEPRDGYVRFIQIRDGSSDKHAVYVPKTGKLHMATKNDLLLVAYRQIGKVFRNMEGAFNVALCKVSPKSSKAELNYLYYLIQSKYVKGELLSRSERALIPSMSVDHLKSLKIPLPNLKKQKEISQYLEEITQVHYELLNIIKSKQKHLIALKTSLLDKAFKGGL